MDELFLYDQEKGLFKEITRKSKILAGRYFVAPEYGNELNTNNLGQFIQDPAYGLTDVKQKYPCLVCMPPRSRIINAHEEFVFQMYFLTTTGYTGNNQVKMPNKATNTSGHHVWYDWQDMKVVGFSFLQTLKKVVKNRISEDGIMLRMMMNVDLDNASIRRLTKFNNNAVSGVGLSFVVRIDMNECEKIDYDADAVGEITVPSTEIHKPHKH